LPYLIWFLPIVLAVWTRKFPAVPWSLAGNDPSSHRQGPHWKSFGLPHPRLGEVAQDARIAASLFATCRVRCRGWTSVTYILGDDVFGRGSRCRRMIELARSGGGVQLLLDCSGAFQLPGVLPRPASWLRADRNFQSFVRPHNAGSAEPAAISGQWRSRRRGDCGRRDANLPPKYFWVCWAPPGQDLTFERAGPRGGRGRLAIRIPTVRCRLQTRIGKTQIPSPQSAGAAAWARRNFLPMGRSERRHGACLFDRCRFHVPTAAHYTPYFVPGCQLGNGHAPVGRRGRTDRFCASLLPPPQS